MLFNVFCLLSWLEAGNHLSLLVDEEFGEVPLDVGLLLVVGISFGKHVIEDVGNGVLHIPSSKAFLLLKELKQGVGIFAVHLYLLEAWEFGAKVQFAEFVNAFVGAWCLLAKLVTGEVEDGKAL